MSCRLPDALLPLLVLMLLGPQAASQDAGPGGDAPDDRSSLSVGHWVRVKGALDAEGRFVGDELELREPSDQESLLGTVTEVNGERARFVLLGQLVHTSARTAWDGVTLDELAGVRVAVEGHYRGPLKFSARTIERRDPGRDRVEGRIDRIERQDGALLLSILSLRVLLPEGAALEHDQPLSAYAFAPGRPAQQVREMRSIDDDDDIPDSVQLSEALSFGGQLEWKQTWREEFDLDESQPGNRIDRRASVRGEFVWEPSDTFFALAGFRYAYETQDEQGEPVERQNDPDLTEAYGFWRNPFGGEIDLQVGRQDFDEPREWIYDRNLDAVRAIWLGAGARLELSASTFLTDASRPDREASNLIAYLSNNDWDRHVAAWVLSRRDTSGMESKPLHAGVRALGTWLPHNDVWAEAALLRGSRDEDRLRGWGLDLGTTWSPPPLEPWSFTVGIARGSGDDDPGDGVDHSFRQTGLHDNNGKFGGVTSFRYYGELLEPELSNLQVLTLGIGRRLGERASLDLVAHDYRQLEPSDDLADTNLKTDPDGVHTHLGHGLDLIFGWRRWEHWDIELILGSFHPGAAFPGADDAATAKAQLRYRF